MERKHGISIYPDKTSIEKQLDYIEKAGAYGYKYVFATMHMPELSMEDQINFIGEISRKIHDSDMKMVVDVRGSFIKEIYRDTDLIDNFKRLGLEALRIDFELEPSLLGIVKDLGITEIFINSSTVNFQIVEKYKDLCNKYSLELKGCHNFYPRPETGLDSVKYLKQEAIFSKLGIENWTFVPNHENPRGPIYAGLPTLEKHRNLSTKEAGLDLSINYKTQNVLIGDGMADDESLKSLQDLVIDKEIELKIRVLNQKLVNKLLDKSHPVRVDSGEYQIRLDGIRQMASHSGLNIEAENTIDRSIGSITVDNKLYKRYEGETQIIKKDLKADEKVNVIAKVIDQDLWLLNYINENKFLNILA